jgi:hypothetical protein
MADIKFRAVWDGSDVVEGFEQLADAPKVVTRAVQQESKKQRTAIKGVGDEAKKVKPIQPLPQSTTNLFRSAKKEVSQLTSEVVRLQQAFNKGEVSALELQNAIELVASKKADLKDLQDAIGALDPDQKAAAFTNLASTGVQAGQGIAGAFALAGVEGENYQKILTRLQGIDAIGQSVRAIGNLPDEWEKAKNSLRSYVVGLEAKTAAQNADFKVDEKASLIKRGLNAIQASGNNLYLAGAIALGVIIATTVQYIIASRDMAEAEKIRNRAVDGTIIKNKEVRDAYNELILVQKKYAIDLMVVTGQLTKFEGELRKIEETRKQRVQLATQDFLANLKESDSWVSKLIDGNERLEKAEKAAGEARIATIEADQAKMELEAKRQEEEVEAAQDLEIEKNKTILAIRQQAGQDTVELEKRIVNQEADLQIQRVGNVAEAENRIALINEQRARQLIAIDKAAEEERVRAAKESADKRKQIAEDLFKSLQALNQQIFAQDDAKNLTPEEAAKAEFEKNIAAISALKTRALADSRSLNAQQKLEIEASLNLLVSESYRQFYEKLAQLRAQEIAKEAADYEASFAERLKRLDASQAIELNDIELAARQAGESEEGFERRKEQAKMQVRLEFAKARLAILQEQGSAESQVEISNLQVLIKQIESEINKSGEDRKKIGREFLKKLLGVDDEGLDSIIAEFTESFLPALQSIYDQQIQQQEEALAKKKELNDREISENERRISELQRQLDLELRANEQGLASNVASVRDAIEAENDARQRNLEDRRRIESEQERLGRRRQLFESGQQLSSIVTAVANIIEGWSSIPLIGSILGIAAAGIMLASFVGLKAKAASASQPPGFAKGTKKAPPGLKWVGEEGPELINDRGGYAIMNNRDSEALMRKYNIPSRMNDEDIENALFAVRSRTNSMNIVPVPESDSQRKAVRHLQAIRENQEAQANTPSSYQRPDGSTVYKAGASTLIKRKVNG